MTTLSGARSGWRLVDIVVAAVVAVAFGVVFLAWNAFYTASAPAFTAIPAAQAILYGVWLLPGVLVALIVRRPGAALFGGFVSAAVSAFLGSQWGLDALISGLVQGLGAELAFALFLYRAWTLPVAVLGGALAGIGAAIHDILVYYPATGVDYMAVYAVTAAVSGVIIAGVGSWLLLRALVRTGVLSAFEAGGDQPRV